MQKRRRWQNIGAYKNLGVNKQRRPQMLAQEKVGGDVEFTASLGRIRSSWFLSNPVDGLVLLPDEVLMPVHVDVKWGKASLCRPLWADSLRYCTGLLYRPAMLKMVKTLAPTKTLASA